MTSHSNSLTWSSIVFNHYPWMKALTDREWETRQRLDFICEPPVSDKCMSCKRAKKLYLTDLYFLAVLFNGDVDSPPCHSLEGKSSVQAIVHGNKLYIITSFFIVINGAAPNPLDLLINNSGSEYDPTEVIPSMQVQLQVVLCIGSPCGFEPGRFLPLFMCFGDHCLSWDWLPSCLSSVVGLRLCTYLYLIESSYWVKRLYVSKLFPGHVVEFMHHNGFLPNHIC